MKTEQEIREMIEEFKREIHKHENMPAFNSPTKSAVEEIVVRYKKKIQVLEWVLEPSEVEE